MGLLDDMNEQPQRQYSCKVRSMAASLEKADADILLAAVQNEKWTINALVNELAKRGLPITKDPIKRHREKQCSCWKI